MGEKGYFRQSYAEDGLGFLFYIITSFPLQKAHLKIFLFRVKARNIKITWGGWGCVGLGKFGGGNEQKKAVSFDLSYSES